VSRCAVTLNGKRADGFACCGQPALMSSPKMKERIIMYIYLPDYPILLTCLAMFGLFCTCYLLVDIQEDLTALFRKESEHVC
jgi:hypothetical protein